jgi:cytochrome c oxidase assembly protein subunit 15
MGSERVADLAPGPRLDPRVRRLPTVSARTYERVAWRARRLTLIVFTGAAVRLTGSGLGCPDWPKCQGGRLTPELDTHGLIEFGNRVLTGWSASPASRPSCSRSAAGPIAATSRGSRRSCPSASSGQAVIGGMSVWYGLAPGWVMAHYSLSMVLLIAAVALVWRAHFEPGTRPRSTDRRGVWAVRLLAPLGFVAIVAGTVATAAGPHAGGSGTGDEVVRLDWRGLETLDWAIKGHARIAALLGVAAVGVWWLVRRRGADPQTLRALTATCVLVAAQGVIGTAQYLLELPAEMVWVHVVLATLTWITIVWAVAAAGRLAPAAGAEPSASARPSAPKERTAALTR